LSIPARLGRFQVLRLLGHGGCGLVFLANDPLLNRAVALKIPRPETLLTPEARQRFLREGRAAGCLEHPNLVPVFEAGETGAICYLASPYCPGITLGEWLQQHDGPVAPRAAALLIATLAGAMHHAHQKGVCHRDLKPSNILLQLQISDCRLQIGNQGAHLDSQSGIRDLESAIPKIIDFGLAKVFHEAADDGGTRSGDVFGTPRYMAPEQAKGKTQAIGPATDIHGLGVILYELLAGESPYQGDTDLEILNKVSTAEPRRPGRINRGVSRDLETICLKCLEKEPENRYRSMTELAEDLWRFLDGRAIQARPISLAVRGAKWLRRRYRSAAVAALAGLALIAVLAWIRVRESAHRLDKEKLLREAGVHKAKAEERNWTVRNQRYAAQIRTGWQLAKQGQLAALRDVLLAQRPAPDQKDVRGFAWHYLWRFGQGFMLPEDRMNTSAIAYSQSAELCASGTYSPTIHLFNSRTGEPLAKLQGHTVEVRTLDFLKNDTQLLSTAFFGRADSGFRGEYILWDLAGGKPGALATGGKRIVRRGSYAHTSKLFGQTIFAPAPAARTLFVIDRDSTQQRLLELDLETGTERVVLTGENIHFAATTPQADKLAIVHWHADAVSKRYVHSLEIIDPATRRQISACRFEKPVHVGEFSPDGKILALGVELEGTPRFVELREVPSLRLRKSLAFASVPLRLRFDWQGKRLAVVTGSELHVFDVQSGCSLGSLQGDGTVTTALAFSPDGAELAVSAANGRVRTGKNVFEPQDYFLPAPLPKSEAWCVAFSANGNLAAGYDHENGLEHQTLRLWDLGTKKTRDFAGHDGTVMAMALAPDGKVLASASYDRSVRLWDLANGECRKKLEGHTGPVRALAFSPDGLRLASAGSDLSINIWNTNDGTLQKSWRAHEDMIRALAFTPDGKLLISAANDRTIKFWDARTWTFTHQIADEAKVQSVACSPDGSLLASGNENNMVELWSPATGTLLKTLRGHSGKVRSVAFAPDGKTLASGGEDKTVRLWNVFTGQELLSFPTEHFINAVAFDRHGKTLAAALHNGTIKVWSAE
jgi:WD40 repeat protein